MKILIIKLRNIGDVLLVSPLFYNLKAHFKDCLIDILVNDGTQGILNTEHLNHIHILKRDKNIFKRFKNEISLLYTIKKESYDLVIGLTSGERSAFLSFFSGAKIRVGFPPQSFWAKNLYTHKIPYESVHNVENNLNALKILKIPIISKKVLPPLCKDSNTKLSQLPKVFFHLHFVSRWMFKSLSDTFCAKIIDFLYEKYQIPCVLTTSNAKKELDKLTKILSLCQNQPIIFAGNLTLSEVATLNSKSIAFIGVDTAIMHLSAANDIPTFAFFGPSYPITWGPWDNHSNAIPYSKNNGIQSMGKHTIYQEDFECVPCGIDGCNHSKKSACLLEKLNEEKALQTLQDFLNPILKEIQKNNPL